MSNTHQQLGAWRAMDELRVVAWAIRGLRFPSFESALGALTRFLAVGGIGLAVDSAAYTIIDGWLGVPAVSRLFSLLLATSVTWQLNRHVTFRAAGRDRAAQALRYTIVAATSQSISYATFLLIIAVVPTIPHLLALLSGAVLGAVVGFSGQSIFGFRDRPMTIAKDRNEQ